MTDRPTARGGRAAETGFVQDTPSGWHGALAGPTLAWTGPLRSPAQRWLGGARAVLVNAGLVFFALLLLSFAWELAGHWLVPRGDATVRPWRWLPVIVPGALALGAVVASGRREVDALAFDLDKKTLALLVHRPVGKTVAMSLPFDAILSLQPVVAGDRGHLKLHARLSPRVELRTVLGPRDVPPLPMWTQTEWLARALPGKVAPLATMAR